jgi:hypothetical protein
VPDGDLLCCRQRNWNYVTYNGSGWSPPQEISIYGGEEFESVSCPSASFCATVLGGQGRPGITGDVFVGPPWLGTNIGPNGIQSISCPSTTFCGIVDEAGHGFIYDPATTTKAVTNLESGGLESISCPSQNFCAIVDDSGNVATYDGVGWSNLELIDPIPIPGSSGNPLMSVSCPTQSFCAAVGGGGTAVMYETPPANEALPKISGTARDGDVLRAASGSWSNRPGTFAYQWRRCAANGTGCGQIAGATASSYTLTAGDVGHRVEVGVSAANGGGSSAAAFSVPSAVVTAALPTVAQVKMALQSLTPKVATIGSILEHGGLGRSFTSPGAGKLTVDWDASVKDGTRTEKTLIAQATLTIARQGKTSVTIKLTAKGKQLLEHDHKPLTVTITSTFTLAGGKPVTVISTLKLEP